eukprot:jgi/Psemu1/44750/gm1.44750_g
MDKHDKPRLQAVHGIHKYLGPLLGNSLTGAKVFCYLEENNWQDKRFLHLHDNTDQDLVPASNDMIPVSTLEDMRSEHQPMSLLVSWCLIVYKRASTAFTTNSSWGTFIWSQQGRGGLYPRIHSLLNPVTHLLGCFQRSDMSGMSGMSGIMSTTPCLLNLIDFLREEYANMMEKEQWTAFPVSFASTRPTPQPPNATSPTK